MYSVSNRIRIYRQMRGFTQAQLAIMIGVTKNAISDYERNIYQPSLTNAFLISNALEVPMNQLFDCWFSYGFKVHFN